MNEETRISIPVGEVGESAGLPHDFKFEIHLDDSGKPYTSRVAQTGSHDLGWVERVARCLKEAFEEHTGIQYSNLVSMSSYEEDTTYVWIRSRVPIPKVALENPPAPKLIGKDFIDVEVLPPCPTPAALSSGPLLLELPRSTSDSHRKRSRKHRRSF